MFHAICTLSSYLGYLNLPLPHSYSFVQFVKTCSFFNVVQHLKKNMVRFTGWRVNIHNFFLLSSNLRNSVVTKLLSSFLIQLQRFCSFLKKEWKRFIVVKNGKIYWAVKHGISEHVMSFCPTFSTSLVSVSIRDKSSVLELISCFNCTDSTVRVWSFF